MLTSGPPCSLRLMQHLLVRQHAVVSAALVFVDTPSNDWRELASVIDARRLSMDNAAGQRIAVYPMMVPQNHFIQVMPDASIDVALSTSSLHWLDQHNPTRPGREGPLPPASSGDDGSRMTEVRPAAWASLAHDDLVAFLSARHAELLPGGMLIICAGFNGELDMRGMYTCLEQTFCSLAAAGLVSPAVTHAWSLPAYLRTMDEFLAGIADPAAGAWKVHRTASIALDHPAIMQLRAAAGTTGSGVPSPDAVERYTNSLAGAILAFMATNILAAYRAVKPKKSQGSTPNETKEKVTQQARADVDDEERFLELFAAEFKNVLRPVCMDIRLGLSYALLRLEKTD